MKEEHPNVCSDIYLGAKMNQKTLEFHNQLYDWSESQKFSNLASKHSQQFNNFKKQDLHLPFQKVAHIDYWARQVNKHFLPSATVRPKSGSFMKIDVTKYNMKVDKDDKQRSKSAVYRTPSRYSNSAKKSFFGTDIHTVKNNLIESQMHYSAQRKDLHSANTRKSTKSARITNHKPLTLIPGTTAQVNDEEPEEESSVMNGLENEEGIEETDSDPVPETQAENDLVPPQIVARSWSNRMLNVITIDDCKLNCRYRPQVIKENHTIPDNYDEMDRARANKLKKENKVKMEKNANASNETDNKIVERESLDHSENIDNSIVDTNNNSEANTCQADKSGNKLSKIHESNDEHALDKTDAGMNGLAEKRNPDVESGIILSSSAESSDKAEGRESSQNLSKTSYGRLTNLYSHSETPVEKGRDKKKMSRTSRINHAIEDMVKERKVMNSLERDFETRTATYGRTIVDKSEGSEGFKKRHAYLRRKIDDFLNTHSAVKTNEFYEKRSRCSSASNSISSYRQT